MQRVVRAAGILLGLIFLIFGLNGFFSFIPVPTLHPFMQILVASGYIYFVKVVEVVAGGLLLCNRAIMLALVLLGADIANIAMYHILLDHRDWPIVPIIIVLYLLVLYGHWRRFTTICQWRA
jgi:hypothetical protein